MKNKKVKNIEIVPFYVKNVKLQNNAMHFSERNSLKKNASKSDKKNKLSMYKIITETSIFAPLCLLFGNR